LIFGETLSPIEFAGAILVMAGLSFNVLGGRSLAVARVRNG
jgi:drug/metabolite transporter (DMT)-like permease